MTHPPRVCGVCHGSFVSTRRDARTCSPMCRQRRRRGTYVVTDEDRAVMDRVALLVPIPVPVLAPNELRAHILATHRRGGERGDE